MNLYKFDEAGNDFLKSLNNAEIDSETGEIINFEEMEASSKRYDENVEVLGCYIKNNNAFIQSLNAEEKNLAERKKALENKNEALKRYLQRSMTATGKTKLETSKVKISFRSSKTTEIDNIEDLLPCYVTATTTLKANKDEIKKALERGIEVKGAHIEEKQKIQIK